MRPVRRVRTCRHTCPSLTSVTLLSSLKTGIPLLLSKFGFNLGCVLAWNTLFSRSNVWVLNSMFCVPLSERRWRKCGTELLRSSQLTSLASGQKSRGLEGRTSWCGGGFSLQCHLIRCPTCPPKCGKAKVTLILCAFNHLHFKSKLVPF